jgi:CheY-like chemotaxis protein
MLRGLLWLRPPPSDSKLEFAYFTIAMAVKVWSLLYAPVAFMNQSPSTPARTILLVEDDQCTALLLKNILQRDGYQVEHCTNGQAALDRLAESSFDAVVLDLMMPHVDGMQALKQMRTNPLHTFTPVIIITAAKLKMVEDEALKYGARLYLEKTQTDRLLIGLREIMEEKQSGPPMKLRMMSGTASTGRKPPVKGASSQAGSAAAEPQKGTSWFFGPKK